jgi:hypothetical protein
VAAQEQGEWVEFQVSDDGPAIDERFHQRIFVTIQHAGAGDDQQRERREETRQDGPACAW